MVSTEEDNGGDEEEGGDKGGRGGAGSLTGGEVLGVIACLACEARACCLPPAFASFPPRPFGNPHSYSHTHVHTSAARWYGTICLICPWLMLVDPVTARSITINVTNSGHPGTVWSSVVTRNTYNTPYRCEKCGPCGSDGARGAPCGCPTPEISHA